MTEKKNVSNDDIYKALMNLTKQNAEIKEEIKSIKRDLEVKTDLIEKKLEKLEEENRQIKVKLRLTERRSKKNNIIIYGYQETRNENILDTILKFVHEKLNIELTAYEINNAYRIGAKSNNKIRPIRLELTTHWKRTQIILQKNKLKGSDIYIKDDLTPEDLEERKLLSKHLAHARKNNIPAKIQNYKLIVNGETLSYEDLKDNLLDDVDITNISPPPNRNNQSAPPTPTLQTNTTESFTFPEVFDVTNESKNFKPSIKSSQKYSTKSVTPVLMGSRAVKTSTSENVRHSERLANCTNKN